MTAEAFPQWIRNCRPVGGGEESLEIWESADKATNVPRRMMAMTANKRYVLENREEEGIRVEETAQRLFW